MPDWGDLVAQTNSANCNSLVTLGDSTCGIDSVLQINCVDRHLASGPAGFSVIGSAVMLLPESIYVFPGLVHAIKLPYSICIPFAAPMLVVNAVEHMQGYKMNDHVWHIRGLNKRIGSGKVLPAV